ncbi:sialic acid-binding Ig-like lectin 14 isoform X18 [Ovis aries]|uniref:sialic acid-binding Ig-like lectin 14 isoform X18 n=1 Tax=Ovis aries TaxID=9940 RepID=UPI001C2E73EC|nr:sialic acid-binding Ig-like lectin 14 isoform X18 [Ovis aries]
MVPLLLLLPLLVGESLQEKPGYRLRVQESLAVQAGLGVRVPCSFSYPWSSWYSSMEPFIYWFREGDGPHSDPVATNNPKRPVKTETQGRFRLLRDPSHKDCSLSISDARMSDTGVYYFRVERDEVKYSYRDKKLRLQVTAPLGKPYIQFPEPLEAGRPTTLTCTLSLASGGGLPLLFSWAGEAVESIDPDTLHSSELTLTPRPQDHGTNLTCWVTLQGSQVTLETTVQLNVSLPPCLSCFPLRCSTVGDHENISGKLHRSEWHVTAHPGGPVPAPGLCGRQQPPSHAELALGGKTPESLPALSPRGPGDTPCRGRRWRGSHLPSSAPTGLPASFLQPLCAEPPSLQL